MKILEAGGGHPWSLNIVVPAIMEVESADAAGSRPSASRLLRSPDFSHIAMEMQIGILVVEVLMDAQVHSTHRLSIN